MRISVALVAPFLLFITGAGPGRAQEPELRPVEVEEVQRLVQDARDLLTDMLWMKTEDYWHTGRWDEAIRLCRQIVQVDPQFVEAYTGAAWLLWSMDEDEEAIALYRAGLAANPTSWEIPHEFGMYFRYRRKWEEAVAQFRRSVELGAPRNYQHMLPHSLESAGRKEEALQEWRAILKRFPDNPIAQRHIPRLEGELAAEEPQAAAPAQPQLHRFC